ncbi:olfactory receptor 2K2-like [Patiria miniata]|uniref:G-protein coupled receptors family 1 profile domain-containing protein n=1 Tax=Patiria miniata TaxID=46514 RepID=A0A914BJN8_PATMI|nr:olfactory receptor 2K2-like [Patiria miniata]
MNTNNSASIMESFGNNSTEIVPFDERILSVPEIFIFVVFPVGLLTNCVFLSFIARNRSLRTPFNIFLSNLSVGGVIFLILALSFTCVGDKEDPFLRGFCFMFAVSYVATSLFVTIVAIERFLAVCFPLRYSILVNDRHRAGKISAVAWLTAAVCGGLVKLVVSLFSFHQDALLLVIVFFCVVFLTTNSVLYTVTLWRLWKRPLASSLVQRRVVIKLAITAGVVFAIDTTHVIYIILHYFLEEKLNKTSFEMIVLALNAANSTINPLMYGLVNSDLKELSWRNVLGRWCFAKRRAQEPVENQPPSRSFRRTFDMSTDRSPMQTLDQ